MASHPTDPAGPSRLRQPGEMTRTIAPLIDIYETDGAIILVADVPGVRPDGVDVVAERDTLTVRGRVPRSERPPEHQEYELIDYFQALTLTDDVDATNVSASLKDGVLRVTIPKSPTLRPKKIQVRTE
jgi:HSP20 family protein